MSTATAHHTTLSLDRSLPDRTLLEEIAGELARIAGFVEDKANANALNKAAYHLSHGVEIILSAGDFLVPSRTCAGTVHRVSGAGCNCKAGMRGNGGNEWGADGRAR
jgi:hypothetical protein